MAELRIIFWNAGGLSAQKARLLKTLLSQRRVDIALINETHLRPVDKLKFSGYYVYREDHASPLGTAYRGLAVLVRRGIVHQPLPVPKLQTSYALGVEICIDHQPTRVFAFYKPPQHRLAMADVRTLLDSPLPTIVAGDFNAKHTAWNSNFSNPEGSRLLDDADRHGYVVLGPEVPTHYPHNLTHIPDVIDLAVMHGLTTAPSIDVLDDHLFSDHQAVLLILKTAASVMLPPPRRVRQDWRKFAEYLAEHSPSYKAQVAEDVDRLASDLSATISAALKASRLEAANTSKPPPLPAPILEMIKEKRKMRRVWQTQRCPAMKTRLNALATKISEALETAASESWNAAIERASGDWTGIHRLCRHLSKKPAPIRPLLASDGTPRYRAEDRAEIFAGFLETQFTPYPTSDTQHVATIERHLESYFEAPIAPTEDPVVFSPGQVQRMIRRTKLRKAPGIDQITNEALRHLPLRAIATLTRIFNGILRSGHFPSPWKLGRVILIPKQGKNVLLPGSYRPITLLPTISKVFEKLLLLHLTPHIQPRDEQFGFRAGHSTTLQVARVLHHLAAAYNKREQSVAVFLDMEKAFDRVWHSGLVYKLSTSTTPRRVVKTVASFLQDRRFQVAVEDVLSIEHPIRAGVPQGSCLSPICYSRYTDDIPVAEGAMLALYADDAAYITTSLTGPHAALKMQRTLDALPAWLESWRLKVNVTKTQAVAIGRRLPSQPVSLLGETVNWSPTAKYLGVIIDRKLKMRYHVKYAVAQTRAARSLLRPLLESHLPLRTKLCIYKTYIRTRLTYAAPAWFALTDETSRKSLRAQQALSLRTIARAPRFVRNQVISRDLHMESLDDYICRLSTSMFGRADGAQSLHLRDMAPYHRRPPDIRGLPRDLVPHETTHPPTA